MASSSLPLLDSTGTAEELTHLDFLPLSTVRVCMRRRGLTNESSCIALPEVFRTSRLYEDCLRDTRKKRGKSQAIGCLRVGRQAQMMPVLHSTSVQIPLVIKLYVRSCLVFRELETAVVRRILVMVTLEEVSYKLGRVAGDANSQCAEQEDAAKQQTLP